MRVLNVAEKPSAAREIVNALTQGRGFGTRDGFSPFNKIFEFQSELNHTSASFCFTSISGHLKELDFGEPFRSWSSCPPGMKALERTLHREARTCGMLILWLDCDSEGENIAYEVMTVCQSVNPGIAVKRARFSAITHQDVRYALQHLSTLDPSMNAMVEARQELDLRAGAAFTRFLTTRIRDKFPTAGGSKVVSYGPCQFPTLALVVDRFLTIQNFRPQDFYVIDLGLAFSYAQKKNVLRFNWNRVRLFDRFVASTLYEMCHEAAVSELGECAEIISVQRNQRTRWRPLPLATVEMQKQVSRKLGMSSEVAVQVAEKLYTAGFISYPRTETDIFNKSMDLKRLVSQQVNDVRWGPFASRLLTPPDPSDPISFQWPRAGKNDDHAHPPIHPTKAAPPGGFESREMDRLYEYIARRFLACCSIDAIGAETVFVARVGAEYFNAKGMIVQRKGFYEVFIYERWVDKELPQVAVRDLVPIESLELREAKTEPPPLLSESDLIALMDRHGIGTDATIAQHIKKVLDRQYISKNSSGRFQPEELGLALVEGYERCEVLLARPHVRAQQERSLKDIVEGRAEKEMMLRGALSTFTEMFLRLESRVTSFDGVFSRFFGSSLSQAWRVVRASVSECGGCHGRMDLKVFPEGRQGPYGRANAAAGSETPQRRSLQCHTCNLQLMLPPFGEIAAFDHICPLCNFQVIRVTNMSRNTDYRLCPKCYNEPPEGAANSQRVESKSFRCFNCTARHCSLATGTISGGEDVCTCLLCQSACSISRTRSDTYRISCAQSSCAFVYFFPRAVAEVTAVEARCAICSSKNVDMTLRSGFVPLGIPTRLEACVWCDRSYHAILDAIAEPRPNRRGIRPLADLEGAHPGPASSRGQSRGRSHGGRGRAQLAAGNRRTRSTPRGTRGRGVSRGRTSRGSVSTRDASTG